MPTISIIGTAGRGKTGKLMTKRLYFSMARSAIELVKYIGPAEDIELVSGGAAWADHLAVSLFLREERVCSRLHLHLPASWKVGADPGTNPQYYDTGVRDWRTNPGGTANFYHRLFGDRMKPGSPLCTLKGIETAHANGAVLTTGYRGFHQRNAAVAKSDIILAYTWGEGDVPADGGTKHTFDLATGDKHHIPLSSLNR